MQLEALLSINTSIISDSQQATINWQFILTATRSAIWPQVSRRQPHHHRHRFANATDTQDITIVIKVTTRLRSLVEAGDKIQIPC
ncbi:MAG: hypothetical protein KF752_10195 [Pirellulaceae bacterium]|nr:hypothetical protein [Pirellulaceae bacterium]